MNVKMLDFPAVIRWKSVLVKYVAKDVYVAGFLQRLFCSTTFTTRCWAQTRLWRCSHVCLNSDSLGWMERSGEKAK